MGTKDYDSSFCRGLVFCTQFKNTFALSILTYPQKQQSQTGVCCICVCPQLIIPSGKSILLLGIFMPFGAVKGGQSHENNQYRHSGPCRRRKNYIDRKVCYTPVERLRNRETWIKGPQEQTLWFWNGNGELPFRQRLLLFIGMIIKSISWTLPVIWIF